MATPNDTTGTVHILLNKGTTCFIDEQDSDLLQFTWSERVQKRTSYAYRKPSYGKGIQMHRLILARKLGRELEPQELVDHVDRNGMNNRRENLRLANSSQNVANCPMRKNNKSGFKGVCFDKVKNRWISQITVNRKQRKLGAFKTPQEAYEAYKAAAIAA